MLKQAQGERLRFHGIEEELAEVVWGILGTPALPRIILSKDASFHLNSSVMLQAFERTMIDRVNCVEGREGSL